MENKINYQCEIFSNRLKKKYKELRKWARKNRTTCYRLYNKDIPEIPLTLDLYEFLPEDITTKTEAALFLNNQNSKLSQNLTGIEQDIKKRTYILLYMYERPYKVQDDIEELFISKITIAIQNITGIPSTQIIKKIRKQQKGLNQYEKTSSLQEIKGLIQEKGQIFKINLSNYLDTGLFLDHRPLREQIRELSKNKRVLNLFCYTASFSVFAAEGNAQYIESVDLSNTYLNWAKENLLLNGFSDEKKYAFKKEDAIKFLQKKQNSKYEDLFDIIILDPPTFSNSKSTENILDINRDWINLVNNSLNLLKKDGILFFSTNSTRLSFKEQNILKTTKNGFEVNSEDITPLTIPKDFEGTKCHKCWKLSCK